MNLPVEAAVPAWRRLRDRHGDDKAVVYKKNLSKFTGEELGLRTPSKDEILNTICGLLFDHVLYAL